MATAMFQAEHICNEFDVEIIQLYAFERNAVGFKYSMGFVPTSRKNKNWHIEQFRWFSIKNK